MLSEEEGNALNQGWSIVPKAPSIELSASKGGQAKLTIGLTFPKLFSLIPGTDQKPKLNNATGLWEGGGASFEISAARVERRGLRARRQGAGEGGVPLRPRVA